MKKTTTHHSLNITFFIKTGLENGPQNGPKNSPKNSPIVQGSIGPVLILSYAETCGLLRMYNNSEDTRFFRGFTGTITHNSDRKSVV